MQHSFGSWKLLLRARGKSSRHWRYFSRLTRRTSCYRFTDRTSGPRGCWLFIFPPSPPCYQWRGKGSSRYSAAMISSRITPSSSVCVRKSHDQWHRRRDSSSLRLDKTLRIGTGSVPGQLCPRSTWRQIDPLLEFPFLKNRHLWSAWNPLWTLNAQTSKSKMFSPRPSRQSLPS